MSLSQSQSLSVNEASVWRVTILKEKTEILQMSTPLSNNTRHVLQGVENYFHRGYEISIGKWTWKEGKNTYISVKSNEILF